ncbi:MAG: hypothetical protein KGL53_00410 [Elusimicrobia bacterium]|nr:hypothetical protein [Elusimicrobiota bacterium]
MRKVVYVFYFPLTERVRRDWCYGYLREHGVPVEYWDINALHWTGVGLSDPKEPGVVLIKDFADLEERVRRPENAGALYLMSMQYEGRYQRLFRLFTRLDARLGRIAWGFLPLSHPTLGSKLRVLVRRPVHGLERAWNKAVGAFSRRTGFVKPFDVVYLAGRAGRGAYATARRVVPINLCDYDNMREALARKERIVPERYALFLDNNQAHNPDIAYLDEPYLDAPRYFASLNRFFGLVERRFGWRVAVAAHPKAKYAADLFEGRPIVQGRTPEMIRDAEFVMCHHSTTIGLAVMTRKPLLFLYTRQMAEIYQDSRIAPMRGFAEYLGAPMVDVDSVESPEGVALRPVDETRYASYKYDFLTSPETEEQYTRDILLREFTAPG